MSYAGGTPGAGGLDIWFWWARRKALPYVSQTGRGAIRCALHCRSGMSRCGYQVLDLVARNYIKNTQDEAELAFISTGECFGRGKYGHKIQDCRRTATRKGQEGKGNRKGQKGSGHKGSGKGKQKSSHEKEKEKGAAVRWPPRAGLHGA